MDLPAHALLAYILAKRVGADPLITTIFGILPDLLVTPLFFFKRRFSLRDLTYFETSDQNLNKKLAATNFAVHNIPFLIVIGTALYFFVPHLFLPFLLGYGSHFLVDFVTHNDKWSLKLLYPFSQKQFPGFFSWYKKENINLFLLIEYPALIILLVFALI